MTNFAGSSIDQNQDGTGKGFSGSFTIALPELTVTNPQIASPANPQSGNLVTVTWNDVNAGNFAADAPWDDNVTVVNIVDGAATAF